MEKIPAGDAQQEKESSRLGGAEKMEVVLGLFGTDAARENFRNLCREYARERGTAPESMYGENYQPGARKYSPPKRAQLHNRIMETLTRLATDARNLTPRERATLDEFYSRENAGTFIREYFLVHEDHAEEDEEEPEERKDGMSGPAYFHSLGKEH